MRGELVRDAKRAMRIALTVLHAIGKPQAKFEDWPEELKSKLYRDVLVYEETIDMVLSWQDANDARPEGERKDFNDMLDDIVKDLVLYPEKISFFNP